MDGHGNANGSQQAPVININIAGRGTRLQVTAPVAVADHGSRSQATTGLDNQDVIDRPPLWRRTAVVWSAVSAIATLLGAVAALWVAR